MRPAATLAMIALALSAGAADVPKTSEQGLSLTFESLGTGAEPDTRTARMLALYVPEAAPPTPFLPPGPFKATWTGDLNLRLRERMSFSAEGRGKVTISIKGKIVFEAAGDDLSQKAGEA